MATPPKVDCFARRGARVEIQELPSALRREVAQLRNDGSLRNETLNVRKLDDGEYAVRFRMRTATLAGKAKRGIRNEEPIALVYSIDQGTLSAPMVFMDRADFPRDLTHVNPVPDGTPVSPCLAREGDQALYEQRRIAGLLHRLDDWLCDAKTDSLNRDGWEPLPVGRSAAISMGIVDSGACQRFVEDNRGTCDWALSVAQLHEERYVKVEASLFERGQTDVARRLRMSIRKDLDLRPAILLWTPNTTVHKDPVFRGYDDHKPFLEDLEVLGVADHFRSAIGQLLISEWPVGPVSVLLAVRRPMPMIAGVPGLADEESARSLEIRAYQLSAAVTKELLDGPFTIRGVSLVHPPSRLMCREVSGSAPKRGAVLLGYGALGSTIGDFLARLGAAPIEVIDPSVVLPHNTARHSADCRAPVPKAVLHKVLEEQLFLGADVTATSHVGRVQEIGHGGLNDKADGRVLIDATAEDSVRRWLCENAVELRSRVLRTEIYDHGRLGVLTVEGESRNPDLLDLYYSLCWLGVSEQPVSGWLRRDRAQHASGMLTGISCASATIALPKWACASHASAFMSVIQPALENRAPGSGVGLNPLSPTRQPLGWRWHPVEAFTIRESHGWSTRISSHARATMRSFATQNAPSESGGYLYGGWDFGLQRITVVEASPLPPESVATHTSLVLGEAGKTEVESRLLTHCGTRLELVGCWHSHPEGSSTNLSETDEATAAGFRRTNDARGLPTLLVVVCGDDIAAHVWE